MLTRKQIQDYRRRLWQIGRIRNQKQFQDLLKRLGIFLIFGSERIPLPKVMDVAHEDADWWNWKDRLQAEGQAYMGRLIQRKATLVWRELLPCFLALYYTQGGCLSYDEEHYYGRLTQQAKWICEELEEGGPLSTDRLRKTLKLKRGLDSASFHKALLELQMKFKVVTVGLVEKGWGTRVMGLFENWVPGPIEREARALGPEKARERILRQLLFAAGALPLSILPRLTGWADSEISSALNSLIRQRQATQATWPGSKHRYWLLAPEFSFLPSVSHKAKPR